MSQDETTINPDQETPGAQSGADQETPGAQSAAEEIPFDSLPPFWQEQFNSLRHENGKMRNRAKEIEQEARKREQERLAQEGKWRELAETRQKQLDELNPYRERAESLESMIRQSNETRVEMIPDEWKSVVPTDYSPERLSAWLDANLERLRTPKAPNLDGGAGGGGGSSIKVTDEDRRAAELAQAAGRDITPEQIAKRRQNK